MKSSQLKPSMSKSSSDWRNERRSARLDVLQADEILLVEVAQEFEQAFNITNSVYRLVF